ncbi:hypothetical protein TSTA_099610 [Talaromyces stipitatus ATCC 10500]|uniref:Uncharacterized protein n=1 Tax=Talaromyces stipitatus (strain ATCC 10500 / CBS 375.48 / QM 6759 / NRRL 1006) TaxID=441959 RepID=B8MMF6_TALSN|nr:uncharacterized protein TSTA_099610 [Talaromyces stipitatus ATCC 10500]EED13710.1 hypothetical protein TSTA_099610 [Talaromyces stipitatus ATCC 10500]
MTTDNASNNNTLYDSIRGTLETLNLPNGPLIERILCMAHVIQLSLTELLGKMEAVLKNDREKIDWTEADEENQPQQENKPILHTLNKIRQLVIYVNRSSTHREHFLNLQAKEPKLVLI